MIRSKYKDCVNSKKGGNNFNMETIIKKSSLKLVQYAIITYPGERISSRLR